MSIGVIEGLSGGLAGKTALAARKAVTGTRRGLLAAGAAGTGVEALGGATGEIAGRVAAGQDMDPAEIGFEAITGTVTAPLNVSAALLTAKKPTYMLNKEEVTYEQMKKFVDTADDLDIAKADIKIENDFTGVGETAKAKQEAATIAIKETGEEAVIQEVEEAQAEVKFERNMEFAKKHSKLYGLKFTELTKEEITERFKDTENAEIIDALGGIVGDEIIINKDNAKKDLVYADNVGNHELLHGIIKASGQSQNITQDTIDNFLNIIGEDGKKAIDRRIKLSEYTNEYLSKNLDEYFTMYSDAIANNEVNFNDNVFTKIADVIRTMFANFGIAKVDFESGRGAYNFLKDYNKSVHKGSLSFGIRQKVKGPVNIEQSKLLIIIILI